MRVQFAALVAKSADPTKLCSIAAFIINKKNLMATLKTLMHEPFLWHMLIEEECKLKPSRLAEVIYVLGTHHFF